MTPIGFIVVIGAAAVAFMLYALVALCRDCPSEKCYVVHILRASVKDEEWDNSSAGAAEVPELSFRRAK